MMRGTIERACYLLCLILGRLLRSGRYSTVRIVSEAGARRVEKFRRFYAPLLVWIGGPLMWLLDSGVRVLPQHDWEERERRLYWTVYGRSIRIDAGGTLLLPYLDGDSLANVLENPAVETSARRKAIERAVLALAEFHRRGFTHGDAMAENVMIDLDAGAARWFDFETVHEPGRPMPWRRADDVRALLVTCLLRTPPDTLAETLRLILDVYADAEVTGLLALPFTSVCRRPLTFHLAQAPLPFKSFREIGRLLRTAAANPDS